MSLELQELVCVRGERTLFSGLTISLQAGDLLLLRGSNGAGKSSLLRIVATLLAPAGGKVLWDGVNVAEDPEAQRRRLRYVGHLDGLKTALTVQENLLSGARIMGSDRHNVGPAMEALGVGSLRHLPVRYLSSGQKRRTALARLAMSPAPLWLLDEPTVGLDDAGIEQVCRLIERHRSGGGIVIAATHVELGLSNARGLRLGRT